MQDALRAVEEVLAETNNAIHLSHLENFEVSLLPSLFFSFCLSLSLLPLSPSLSLPLPPSLLSLQEHQSTVGKLFFQGSLQVSEPKFAIKAEKERQVFVFDAAIVFARKVCLENAEFKYEYKSKIAVRSSVV